MELNEIPFQTIDGATTSLSDFGNSAILVVNVASRCGLTPQYTGLEALQETYRDRGFTVIGFPCNQFMGQEPGTAADIKSFCSMSYGVTFPLMEKVRVNGRNKHPLYAALHAVPDGSGKSGRVKWNFEKFLIATNGEITRFRPTVEPQDPAIIAAIEAALPDRT